MNSLKKNGLIKARKLYNWFRFTDDLNMINHGGEFENNFNKNYLEELQFNKED